MSKATFATLLVHGDTNTLDGAAVLEELLDFLLFKLEAEVSDKDGCALTILIGATVALGSTTLATKLNLDATSKEFLAIFCILGFLSLLVCLILNEGQSAKELALGESSMSLESLTQGLFIHVVGKLSHAEFGLILT
uniref:Uncharacterized protein n=1 Tax=Strombidinopsis acuminata TaxID=141414 RepID=A0A7S3TVY3_9SPIT|eukprot:CAMPEP_0176374326 /NCGR_PEP_ID=MMETSP0126-20121128/26683_1 /TAXON_ID=141414 ORGANISM="Strombidinopsis acuminatum, Strain SPMC142" /NCGR_SAMPLE_ID=MMETSP0126 /ASSEMBLY_ACC=CAM_ASM_000229 /LENGTH=136 /DNA_ID=CAMNT_0017734865 /DNA_START=262 /DNA_END=672 /DNA_ORIENTATION=-